MSGLAAIARDVRSGKTTARTVTEAALERIRSRDAAYGAFTRVLVDRARADADVVDAQVALGKDPGPLAGVPFAVKDLFDVEGLPTTAGAKMRLDVASAIRDAVAVARLKAAGAVLVGTCTMDEYAYGFATVNAHFGTTKNPHDLTRLAGGSSGGSAAAVAADLVPLSLGSDTNGSIRVPASLCGVWGLRPAENAISLDGVFPFVEALDTIGPFTRSLADLKLAYEVLSGTSVTGGAAPRVARLGGFFLRNASSDAAEAVETIAAHLGSPTIDLSEAEAARSAAFLITAAQGGALHLDTLRTQAMDYDPAVRDRLLAGAMLPAAAYIKAWDFRARWRQVLAKAFETFDVLIAPSTPIAAPPIDAATVMIDGRPASARANLGIYAQPLSLGGMMVVSAPLRRDGLPIGVQFAAAPGREGLLFDLLQRLEREGVLGATTVAEGVA